MDATSSSLCSFSCNLGQTGNLRTGWHPVPAEGRLPRSPAGEVGQAVSPAKIPVRLAGQRACPTHELRFDRVVRPAAQRLGRRGEGIQCVNADANHGGGGGVSRGKLRIEDASDLIACAFQVALVSRSLAFTRAVPIEAFSERNSAR